MPQSYHEYEPLFLPVVPVNQRKTGVLHFLKLILLNRSFKNYAVKAKAYINSWNFMHCVVLPTRHCKIANFNCCAQTETYLLSNCSIFSRFVTTLLILRGNKILISLLSNQQEVCKASTGHEINFFSDSHLAPKFFKVVANSKEVGRHFQRQTNLFFYAVIVLEIK